MQLQEKLSPKQKAFRKYFFDLMDEFEIDSPAKLKGDEDKKKFWNAVSSGWKKVKKEQFNESVENITIKEKVAFRNDVKACLKEAAEKAKNNYVKFTLKEGKTPEDIVNQVTSALSNIGMVVSKKAKSGTNDKVWFLTTKGTPVGVASLSKALGKFSALSPTIVPQANNLVITLNLK